jgi:hypothetical protein
MRVALVLPPELVLEVPDGGADVVDEPPVPVVLFVPVDEPLLELPVEVPVLVPPGAPAVVPVLEPVRSTMKVSMRVLHPMLVSAPRVPSQ